MAPRRSSIAPGVLRGLLVLISLGGQLVALPAADAQADSSRAPAATGTPAARDLLRQHCVKCHGADGTGSAARRVYPAIPDFTDASWQARRSEAQLLASILDGKGREMPPWRGKINEDQARDLVAHVRSFAPTTDKPGPEKQRESTSPSGFEKEFRRLQEEMAELKKQFRELSEGSADRERSKPSESAPRAAPAKPSAPSAAGAPAARELFRQHCVRCHGADGTGSPVRRRRPEIPDFTDASWQARRNDAQLLASILDGKGKEMPPWRGKINEDQARGLVARVRAFAPTTESPGREEQAKPYPGQVRGALPLPSGATGRVEQEVLQVAPRFPNVFPAARVAAPHCPGPPGGVSPP